MSTPPSFTRPDGKLPNGRAPNSGLPVSCYAERQPAAYGIGWNVKRRRNGEALPSIIAQGTTLKEARAFLAKEIASS